EAHSARTDHTQNRGWAQGSRTRPAHPRRPLYAWRGCSPGASLSVWLDRPGGVLTPGARDRNSSVRQEEGREIGAESSRRGGPRGVAAPRRGGPHLPVEVRPAMRRLTVGERRRGAWGQRRRRSATGAPPTSRRAPATPGGTRSSAPARGRGPPEVAPPGPS